MQWEHGPYGCSAKLLDGLVELYVTVKAKKAVTIEDRSYARNTVQAHEAPGNLVWEAEVSGRKTHKVGKFPTKEEAMAAAEKAFIEVYAAPLIKLVEEK